MERFRAFLKRTGKAVVSIACVAETLVVLGAAAGCSSKNNNELAQNIPGKQEISTQDTSDKSEIPSQNTSDKSEIPSQNTSDKQETPSQNTTDKADEYAQITDDKAKEAALSDAGLTSSEVTFTKIKLDREDGIYVYDIEFYTDSTEYEYEINASTGKVYSKELELRDNGNIGQGSNGDSKDYITEEDAKAIAVRNAGFSASDVKFSKVKLDYEDGQKVYEIEFYKDGIEYEYEINAVNGKIIKFEID